MGTAVFMVLAIVRMRGGVMRVMLVGIDAVIVVRVEIFVHHGGGHSRADAESYEPFEVKTHDFP